MKIIKEFVREMDNCVYQNSTRTLKIFSHQGAYLLTSYDKPVALLKDSTLFLDRDFHNYSTTTSIHLGKFLREYTNFKTPKEARADKATAYTKLS